MSGFFTVPASPGNDISKGSQYPALITKIEIRKGAEDASQWQDLGPLTDAELTINGAVAMAQGKRPVQLQAYEVAAKATLMTINTAVRTALDKINETGCDFRITTVSGDVYTFQYTDGIDGSFNEERKGTDVNTPAAAILTIGGSISKAVYVSCYVMGS